MTPVQNEIEIPVIRKQKSVTYKIAFGLCIFLGLITLITYIERNSHRDSMLIISIVTFLVVSLFIDFRSLKIKEYKIIGGLILRRDEISVEVEGAVEEYNFSDLSDIRLIINETARDPKGWREGSWGINRLKDGIRNSIEFKTSEDQYYCIHLLIQDCLIIEKLDTFLNEVKPPIQLIRNNRKINSIRDEHYKDYPAKYINTRMNEHNTK